ncbi:MAG: D-lyxose/D-mannose family sugar isomerase [Anaerolineae bacterium]|nr:D-lyxose/D-mannose family sugar isomerase [Phycisphaerae bacterium]
MDEAQLIAARARAATMLAAAGIILTPEEATNIEVADFGLGRLEAEGLEIVTYENNDRYCAKELVLFSRQTCPEHRHPPVSHDPGKRETFRVRQGVVWLYVEGPTNAAGSATIRARIPEQSKSHYTVFHEIELHPGQQYTIEPNARHWFQAGDTGAIISEFSSTSRDEADMFTDPSIRRVG